MHYEPCALPLHTFMYCSSTVTGSVLCQSYWLFFCFHLCFSTQTREPVSLTGLEIAQIFCNGMLDYLMLHPWLPFTAEGKYWTVQANPFLEGTRSTNITVTTVTIKGKTLLQCCQTLCNYGVISHPGSTWLHMLQSYYRSSGVLPPARAENDFILWGDVAFTSRGSLCLNQYLLLLNYRREMDDEMVNISEVMFA